MDDAYILSHIDHTLLAAYASWQEVCKLCDESIRYNTASVCVPPHYVKQIRDAYPQLCICTVIGFPLGYDSMTTKTVATRMAVAEGADELDMVVNLADVKNGKFDAVKTEISVIKQVAESKLLKVIIETCYLTEEEKITLCKIVTEAGADYIKTSTGFGTAGATFADVALFRAHVGPLVKIKAAGGIRSREDMVAFLNAGCSRLGTSSAVKLLTSGKAGAY